MDEERTILDDHLVEAFNKIPYKDRDYYYLYKHVRFDENLYVLGIFENQQIKFTEPNKFNDPFDCEISISLEDVSYSQYYKYYKRARRRLPKKEWGKITIHTAEYFKAHKHEILNEMKQALTSENINENMGVSCFNTHPTNILMWSHYADNHKGFAVEFKLPFLSNPEFEMLDSSLYARPIIYTNDFPTFRLNLNSIGPEREFSKLEMEEATIATLTKAKDWEYENEWRMSDIHCRQNTKGTFLKIFPPHIITAVILGLRIEADHEKKLRLAIKHFEEKFQLKVPIYKAAKIPNQFGLTIPNHPYYGHKTD